MRRGPLYASTLLLLLLAAGAAWWGWREHARAERLAAELADLRAEAARRIPPGPAEANPPGAPAPAAPEPAPPAEPVATAPAREGPPPRPEATSRGGPGRGPGGFADLLADPLIGPRLIQQRKAELDRRYAALFRRLNLPPAQLEQLKTLLAEKQIAQVEATMLGRSQGLNRDDVRDMARLADTESDAAIRRLLGDAGFAQYANYEDTFTQRTAVAGFADRLSYSPNPLTADQSEQLIQLLAAHDSTLSQSPDGRGFGPFGALPAAARSGNESEYRAYLEKKAAADAEVLRRAATFLSATQLDALQQMQQEQTERIELARAARDRLRSGPPPAPSPRPGG